MGPASGLPKSEVSRIRAGLDERVTAFRDRTLDHTEFPYVYLDELYAHVRDDTLGQVVPRAVVVATPSPRCSGRRSRARSRQADCLVCAPSPPMLTRDWAYTDVLVFAAFPKEH